MNLNYLLNKTIDIENQQTPLIICWCDVKHQKPTKSRNGQQLLYLALLTILHLDLRFLIYCP